MKTSIRIGWTLLLLTSLSCGSSDFVSALQLTLQGEIATTGVYQVELRNRDGSPIGALTPQTVAAREGDAQVTVVIESETLFGQATSLDLRVLVSRFANADTSGDPDARGSLLITVEKGATATGTVNLLQDPRLSAASITLPVAWYSSSTSDQVSNDIINLEASAFPDIDYAVHLWARDDNGATTWVTSISDATTATTLGTLAPLISDSITWIISAEPEGGSEQLARTNGWEVFSGSIDETYREAVETLILEESNVERLLTLVGFIERHAGFAQDNIAVGNQVETRRHAEHVHNLTAGMPGAVNLDGMGATEFSPDDSILDGIAALRSSIATTTGNLLEVVPSTFTPRISTEGNFVACNMNVANETAAVLQRATDLVGDTTVARVQSMLEAVANLKTAASTACFIGAVERLSEFEFDTIVRR